MRRNLSYKKFGNFGRKSNSSRREKRSSLFGTRRRPLSRIIEQLEQRVLLTVELTGVPTWLEQGPGPEVQAGSVTPQNNEVAGAVQSIAVNPNNSSEIIVGTVNGGVWRSTNADSGNPGAITWTPLTDQLGSLGIGAVLYDPADNTGNSFYAGTGVFSNSFDTGGPAIGLYHTTDAGTTWTLLGQATLTGHRIKGIVVTGSTIVVGTVDGTGISQGANRDYSALGGGLFRSTDGGSTFSQIVGVGATALPAGAVPSILQDPNSATRVYAAIPGLGVYRTDDITIATPIWTQVNTGLTSVGGSSDMELAAQNIAGSTTLFVGISTGGTLNGVFTSPDNGGTWTPLAATPGAFNAGANFTEKFQIVADPTLAGVVYIDGQGGGARIFRYDPSGSGSWVQIHGTGFSQNNTDPHADSHDLKFLDNDTILESDDGGIYVLNNPTDAANNSWNSFNGNLKAHEFYSVAYDSTNDILFGGAQDNGSPHQNSPNNTTWTRAVGGDGQTAQVDTTSLGGDVFRYSEANNFNFLVRLRFDNGNSFVSSANVGLRSTFGGVDLSGLNAADAGYTGFDFIPYVLNATDPRMMLIGYTGLYEDADTSGANGFAGDVITDITANLTGLSNNIFSLAYGGFRNGMAQANVAIVGTRAGQLFFRGESGSAFTNVSDGGVGELSGGGDVNDIAVDPDDWRQVYVVKNNQVWFTPNITDLATPGNGFRVIGGGVLDNLALLTTQLRSIALFDNTASVIGDAILLVGALGGVYSMLPTAVNVWTEYGLSLPNTVVHDVRYDATDDIVTAATFGRGAWTLTNVSQTINSPGILTICGDEDFVNEDDTIRLVRDPIDNSLLDVFINNNTAVPDFQVPLAVIYQINVFAGGGNDNLIVDSSNGLISVPNGIKYDGDHGCPDDQEDDFFNSPGIGGFDQLTLVQTGGPTIVTDTLSPGATPGEGRSVIADNAGGVQRIDFQYLEPIIDSVPSPNFTIAAVAGLASVLQSSNAINYQPASLIPPPLGTVGGRITIDNFEPIEFTNKDALIIDAGAGSDSINLNNPNLPTGFTAGGLKSITVIGNDPTASDTVIANGTTGADNINYAPTDPYSATITGAGPVTININTVEHVTINGLDGGDTLTYTSPANSNLGSDLVYTPGAVADSGTITGRIFGGLDLLPLAFTNIGVTGNVTFATANTGRHDELDLFGTSVSDRFTVNGTGSGSVQIFKTGASAQTVVVNTPSIVTLYLRGLDGDDQFNVTGPVPYSSLILDGGNPSSSDIVNLSGAASTVTVSLGDNTSANPFTTITGYGGTITLDGVEQANLNLNNQALSVQGTAGDDTINFTPSSATAGSFIATTTGPLVAASPQFTYSNLATGITVNGGSGFDLLGLIATAGNDIINAVQTSATALSYTQNAFTIAFTFSSIDGANIFALAGDDLIRISVADALETTTPADALRFDVDGGPPNASDRLVVNDDGLGDLILWRQANDQHSGSIAVGAFAPVVYINVERVDITPVNPITGGTGTDGAGRIKVFHTDPFEYNDTLPNSAQLQRIGDSPTSPNIDPGGITLPAPFNFSVPGDEDWYSFRPQATGTFQVKILFATLATLSNGRPGLPGMGDLDLDIYDANGVLITSGTTAPGGKAAIFAATNDPAFPDFNVIYVRVHGHTADSINIYDFDNIAALITGLPGVTAADLEGPQVTDVRISDPNTPLNGTDGENLNYNLFGLKPGNAPQGPTPLVNAITINFKDLPARFPGFLYPAIDYMLTADQARGLFSVVGDANGIVAIKEVRIHNDPVSLNAVPTGEIQIIFEQPLPDDRFTLTINDSLRDPAQNRLDGESNASEPNNGPFFPSGDGHSGGDFVARFTVDTRPELGDFAAARVYIDINGNSIYDPQTLDFTNRDLIFTMQLDPTLVGRAQLGVHDSVFAGNFADARGVADGFSKLGLYGTDPVAGPGFRWLLDTDDNGTADLLSLQATGFTMFDQNGAPVVFKGSGIAFAGNFDGNAANGDEIGLWDQTHFFLDTNHNFVIDAGDTVITSALRGFPIVGDFNGDGTIDLATWQTDVFQFNFGIPGTGGNSGIPAQYTGTVDAIINFGFPGVGEVPLAADMDMDGITDIGLWVPGRAGSTTADIAETFFLISHDFDPATAMPRNTGLVDPDAAFNLLNHAFTPTPLGNDLYSNFLDEFATPIVGNFDPPLVPATPGAATDDVAPTSSVNALAATQSSLSFNVSWSGSDGNGIAGYDIYVSDNGGAFARWQSATTSTSAVFTGQNGHNYSFFSVATDNSGNVQLTPAGAQATTNISIRSLTTTVLAASNTSVVPGQAVTFTATVSAVDSSNPVPSGTVTFKDGTKVLSTVTVSGGVASLTISNLAAGNHNITATYNAVAPSVGSTSATLVERIVSAALEADPSNPALTALFIGGTSGNDIITLASASGGVSVKIKTGSKTTSLGTFNPTGHIYVSGMAGNDTLVAASVANVWEITGANSGTLNGNPFDGIENLTGGSSTDVFHMNTGGSISGKIGGGAGSDTLVAADQANTWNITATNAGKLNGTAFAGMENLTGGDQNDNFVFARAKGVTGHIDGGAGINMLNYAAYTTSVKVDLAAGTATNIGGGVSNISVVRGGIAADTLSGDDNNNALIGGGGNDNILAGSGRNLLFGGLGADTINGGAGENIMFAGTTTFESNVATIDNLLSYWSRADLDYNTRVADLKTGSVNGVPALNSTTVKNDTSVNKLNGGTGLDWFFAKLGSPKDTINNQVTGEQVN